MTQLRVLGHGIPNNILISGQWEDDNEMLCEMELRLLVKRIQRESIPGPLPQQSCLTNRSIGDPVNSMDLTQCTL